MERDLGPLRCSKLNCYVDFNKMVQAVQRYKQSSSRSVPLVPSQHGTSIEYNFYNTLSLMLQQIKSNNNAESQKKDLQELYKWFVINKPFTKSKSKPMARKPALKMTTTTSVPGLPDRPQTAPAAFHEQTSTHFRESTSNMKQSEDISRRPSTSFASRYMSNSLGSKISLAGISFEQLKASESFKSLPELPVSPERSKPFPCLLKPTLSVQTLTSPATPQRNSKAYNKRQSLNLYERSNRSSDAQEVNGYRPSSPSKAKVSVSVQSLPSPEFLNEPVSNSHKGLQPQSVPPQVYLSEVFNLAPKIAADMSFDRSVQKAEESDFALLRELVRYTAAPVQDKAQSEPSSPRKSLTSKPIPVSTSSRITSPRGSREQAFLTPSLSDHPQVKAVSRAGNHHNIALTQPDDIGSRQDQVQSKIARKTGLSDIKEESETTSGPPTRQGDGSDRNTMEVVSSEVVMSDTLLDETGGRLHYNSTSSFSGGTQAGPYPITVAVVEQSGRHAPHTPESKSKKGVSCSVISITFEAGAQAPATPSTCNLPKTPSRTPNSAAGFRKRRYYRPQIVKPQDQ